MQSDVLRIQRYSYYRFSLSVYSQNTATRDPSIPADVFSLLIQPPHLVLLTAPGPSCNNTCDDGAKSLGANLANLPSIELKLFQKYIDSEGYVSLRRTIRLCHQSATQLLARRLSNDSRRPASGAVLTISGCHTNSKGRSTHCP